MRVITLASGSSGNCALVSDGRAQLLIDAGISARRIVGELAKLGVSPGDISGILITHEHRDHICGLGTLTKKYQIPLFAPGSVGNYVRWSVPGADECLELITPGEAFAVGGLEVKAFRTPHDTPESVGYTVLGVGRVSLCTDLGYVPDEVYYALEGSDAVVLESNHDEDMLRNGDYPYFLKRRILSDNGHLSNKKSAMLARALVASGTRSIILAHLSRENNTPELARHAYAEALPPRGFEGIHIRLEVAPPDSAAFAETGEDAVCSA